MNPKLLLVAALFAFCAGTHASKNFITNDVEESANLRYLEAIDSNSTSNGTLTNSTTDAPTVKPTEKVTDKPTAAPMVIKAEVSFSMDKAPTTTEEVNTFATAVQSVLAESIGVDPSAVNVESVNGVKVSNKNTRRHLATDVSIIFTVTVPPGTSSGDGKTTFDDAAALVKTINTALSDTALVGNFQAGLPAGYTITGVTVKAVTDETPTASTKSTSTTTATTTTTTTTVDVPDIAAGVDKLSTSTSTTVAAVSLTLALAVMMA
jgi:hypothetical protein